MQISTPRVHTSSARLSVAFVLTPNFTLLALSAFVDTLRLAADEGDRSRPIQCHWDILSHDMMPIRSSCGVKVVPTSELNDPSRYTYIAVIGGLIAGSKLNCTLLDYLRLAAARTVPLIGVCTGSFVLARLGLMHRRQCCVSWFHHRDFEAEFPNLQVRADEMFIVDHDRLTCAGGISVIHLASYLVEKHCQPADAMKALRILIVQSPLPPVAPQPQPLQTRKTEDTRLRKAMLMIERNIATPLSVTFIAQRVGVSCRQLERLFRSELGQSPSEFALDLRLTRANELLCEGCDSILDIAIQCGFITASHFSRRFRAAYGLAPSAVRRQRKLPEN